MKTCLFLLRWALLTVLLATSHALPPPDDDPLERMAPSGNVLYYGKLEAERQLNYSFLNSADLLVLNKLIAHADGRARLSSDPKGGFNLGQPVPPSYYVRDWVTFRPIYAGEAFGYNALIKSKADSAISIRVNVNIYRLQPNRHGNGWNGVLVIVRDYQNNKTLSIRTILNVPTYDWVNPTSGINTFGLASDLKVYKRAVRKGENAPISAALAFAGRRPSRALTIEKVVLPLLSNSSGNLYVWLAQATRTPVLAIDFAGAGSLAAANAEYSYRFNKSSTSEKLRESLIEGLKRLLKRAVDFLTAAIAEKLEDVAEKIVDWVSDILSGIF